MTQAPETAPKRQHQRSSEIADNTYNAAHLLVLEGLEAVRKRPGMYIGSTDTRGLMHCVWEIIDNGVDEALAGAADRVEVLLHPDGSVEVHDNGRGIPTDKEPRTGLPGVEVVATKLHAGGKFGGGSYVATGGLHGVGLSVVNALSSRMDIDVERSPAVQGLSFQRGVPGVFAEEGPGGDFEPRSGLTRKGGRVAKGRTGTRIRFWPDRQIFTRDATYVYDELVTRARQTSFIVPGLEIIVRDLRGEEPVEESFKHDGGITEFADFLSPDEPVTSILRLQGSDVFTETVPLLDDKGHMTPQEIERELTVDVAVRWGTGYETTLRSFVNVIATPKGGTHVSGFETALTKTFNDVMRASKALKVNDPDVIKDDVLEGLTSVVTVRLAEPQFEGQTKGKLGNTEARGFAQRVVNDQLGAWFEENPNEAKEIIRKAQAAQQARNAARKARDLARDRKGLLGRSSLPGKLSDCQSTNPTECEVFIVEGDSAGGSAKSGRDPRIQAILPIRGKILNVEKARIDKVLGNAEVQAIISALGTGIHDEFDLEKLRYHKVVLMADADVDGHHINTLLLTLLFRFMKPLIEHGYVYMAQPPLYRLRWNKPHEHEFVYSDAERDALLRAGTEAGKKLPKENPVQRYKGLGEMNADELWETTMDPDNRLLLQVTLDDAAHADEIFSILMGEDVDQRRSFIQRNAKDVRFLDI